jgi:phospholipase C
MHSRAAAISALALFAIAASIGCSSGGSQQSMIPSSRGDNPRHHRKARPQDSVIQHVVIVIQENRSFNTIFGGPHPFPNASTSPVGYQHDGAQVALSSIGFADTGCDISHNYEDAEAAVRPSPTPTGPYQMNGFDLEKLLTPCSGDADKRPYKYVSYNETKPYWFMASHWGLADHFYPTELGPSFTSHINFIAGTDKTSGTTAAVDNASNFGAYPDGCKSLLTSPPPYVPILHANGDIDKPSNHFPCFWEFHTMADLLDAANPKVTWNYYAPTVNTSGGNLWSEFSAIEKVRCGSNKPIEGPCSGNGADWKNIITPSKQVLRDIDSGNLANVVWVVPTLANSDHQGSGSTTGPAWVASIVNAIGKKTTLWNNTVIVVVWDDWGGWYDEVAPPQYDFRGKGIRTPMMVISAYIKSGGYYYYGGHGWLSHWVYEPGSILKYIENVFATGHLDQLPCYYYCMYGNEIGYTDRTSQNGIADNMLDTTQTPRPFTPVPTPSGYDENFFLNQPESAGPPDTQ